MQVIHDNDINRDNKGRPVFKAMVIGSVFTFIMNIVGRQEGRRKRVP